MSVFAEPILLDSLFLAGRTAVLGSSSVAQEYIGNTLSIESDAVSAEQLLRYTKDNFSHARCIIGEKWVYAYNGKLLKIKRGGENA